jgi:hypothetical protein
MLIEQAIDHVLVALLAIRSALLDSDRAAAVRHFSFVLFLHPPNYTVQQRHQTHRELSATTSCLEVRLTASHGAVGLRTAAGAIRKNVCEQSGLMHSGVVTGEWCGHTDVQGPIVSSSVRQSRRAERAPDR